MGYPRKAKGWRNIVVDNQKFRWRFAISASNTLTLQGPSSGQQAIVTLHDWFDPWRFIGQNHLLPNDPAIITPRFAQQAIEFALAHGWQPDRPGPALCINYQKKIFSL